MRSTTLAAALLGASALAAMAQVPEVRVLTYDSFTAEWGPGPAIEAGFEVACGCDLVFETAGDGAAMLARLMLTGARTEADVVVGLDTNLMSAAAASGMFAPHGLSPALALPVDWADPVFLPYDWGWFAFVHDTTRLPVPPASFEELIASDLSVVIQDPRSSTPGLGLLMWVHAAYGDRAGEIWRWLAPRILTVTPGWSEAYGLFLEGEADMVLSYTTSPAYHRIAEGDATKAAAPFAEGHYLQIEVAAALGNSDQPALARQFLDYLVSGAAQAVIPTTNWMYPAIDLPGGLPEGFDVGPRPAVSLLFTPDEAAALRESALAEWRDALAR